MNDLVRNRAILESIAALDLADKVVFEIGTGAGLTAMYFARSGARHVYTCEMDNQLYEMAVTTIARNGLSDRITVIHKSSTDYIRSEAFDFSPDVIFTETLDCGVVGEGFAAISRDIASIAREDTIILPSEIRQFGFLVNSPDIAAQNCVLDSAELDLSLINEFSTFSYFPVRYQLHRSKTLSPVYEMRRYDYLERSCNAATFAMTAYGSGVCHGVLSYFHAKFGASIVSNDVRDTGHWHQAFHPFPKPIQVASGATYSMVLQTDGAVSLLNG